MHAIRSFIVIFVITLLCLILIRYYSLKIILDNSEFFNGCKQCCDKIPKSLRNLKKVKVSCEGYYSDDGDSYEDDY